MNQQKLFLLYLSIFFIIFFIDSSTADIFTKKAPLFYKTPDSLFPSGQLSEEELWTKRIRSETTSSFQVQWDRKVFQYKQEELLKEIQVADQAIVRTGLILFQDSNFKQKNNTSVSNQEVVKILSLGPSWALVEKYKGNGKGYLPLDLLESFSEDIGVGFTITSLFLKEQRKEESKLITTIPQKERVKIISWDNEKLFIQYQNFKGYVNSELVFMKADFATQALHQKDGWLSISYRKGTQLVDANKKEYPISDFKAYITNKYLAFSLINKINGPKIRSRLEIKNLSGEYWHVSLLPEHGEVWWKKTMPHLERTNKEQILKTDELIKRKIYSMAFYPETKLKGLISAEGVFKTIDGDHWKKIDFFKNENWPVTISKNKIWIVGNYKSLNEGESFEPYIRWDTLSQMVESTYSLSPKFMKLLKLEAKENNDIDLWLDTGFKKIKMRHSLDSSQWTLLK